MGAEPAVAASHRQSEASWAKFARASPLLAQVRSWQMDLMEQSWNIGDFVAICG